MKYGENKSKRIFETKNVVQKRKNEEKLIKRKPTNFFLTTEIYITKAKNFLRVKMSENIF